VRDRELEDEQQPPTRGHHDTYQAVHQKRSRGLSSSRELLGHRQRTSDLR
jgi:hypothetical protein